MPAAIRTVNSLDISLTWRFLGGSRCSDEIVQRVGINRISSVRDLLYGLSHRLLYSPILEGFGKLLWSLPLDRPDSISSRHRRERANSCRRSATGDRRTATLSSPRQFSTFPPARGTPARYASVVGPRHPGVESRASFEPVNPAAQPEHLAPICMISMFTKPLTKH